MASTPQMSDHDADELLGTPVLGEVAAGYLQDEVADEEDAGGQSLLGGVDAEVLVEPVEGEPDIGPVHERDDVDDDRDGNQPLPPGIAHCRC